MEREKMIETILRYMCPFFSDGICRGEIRCHDDCIKRSFAKDAVNELIPDGAVVLTKEELEKMDNRKNYGDVVDTLFFRIRVLKREHENRLEQIRKDTAREIFNKVIEYLENQQKRYDEEYQKWFSPVTKDKIDKWEIESIREFEMEQYGHSIKANGCRLITDKAIENIRKIAKEYGVEVEE